MFYLPLNRSCRDCRYYRDIGVGFCVLWPLGRPSFAPARAVCSSYDSRVDDDDDDPHRQLASVPP